MKIKPYCLVSLLLYLPVGFGCQQNEAAKSGQPMPATVAADERTAVTQSPVVVPDQTASEEASASAPALSLFDGQSLDGWEVTNFGGEGECRAEDGKLIMEAGYPMSGVTSTRTDLPKTNYEISLEVQRTQGIDFFCGLTFPVAESHCTFIVGGWAGSVVGLSCIDDADASRNETRKLMKFEPNQWYKIKVKVKPDRISAWIDDEQVVDQDITDRKISVRNETLPSRPLGICNFETTSEFRHIELKRLLESPE